MSKPDPFTKEILESHRQGLARKAIARKLAIDVKRVRRVLEQAGIPPGEQAQTGKLDPFREAIQEKVTLGLTSKRILREIGEDGYQGGVTILRDYVRTLRGPQRKAKSVFRRFETAPGVEAQVDWSPYRVMIGGREVVVHCFSIVLAWSRLLFIQFHRNEQLPTLLAAHVDAFSYFGGVPTQLVYDNMTTVTFGRRGGKPLWNAGFLKFAEHWSFTPVDCRPRHPDRKGKVEKPFTYLEEDFLLGSTFESWHDLDVRGDHWLRNIANVREHQTTREVAKTRHETVERGCLTAPPDTPFPTHREEVRAVYHDCTISMDGAQYSVPSDLARNTVAVRVHPRHIEIRDSAGVLRAQHKIPDRPCLVIDPAHYSALKPPRRTSPPTTRDFLGLFPDRADFLEGIKERMKGLYPVHIGKIQKLIQIYGLDLVAEALATATKHRNFNAHAVQRILQREFPLFAVEPTPNEMLLHSNPQALADIDLGSLADYSEAAPTDDEATPTDDGPATTTTEQQTEEQADDASEEKRED